MLILHFFEFYAFIDYYWPIYLHLYRTFVHVFLYHYSRYNIKFIEF